MGACCSKTTAIVAEQVTKHTRVGKKAKMLAPYGETREITPEVKTIQKLYGF